MNDTQIFQLIGIFYISVSAGMILNPRYYKDFLTSYCSEPAAIFLSGMVAIVAGYALVIHHNVWNLSTSVVITIFGWLVLLKGIFVLTMPGVFIRAVRKMSNIEKVISLQAPAGFLIGIIFMLLSF